MSGMILCILFLSSGGEDALETYTEGELYLLTIGKPSTELFRDSVTGMLYRSMGCAVGVGDLEYMRDWNDAMTDAWRNLFSEETFMVLRAGEESLEFRDGSCVYRDSWGSVPIQFYPEELLYMVRLTERDTRVESEAYGRLELYVPFLEDTAAVTVPIDSNVLRDCFQRGREAIRVNIRN